MYIYMYIYIHIYIYIYTYICVEAGVDLMSAIVLPDPHSLNATPQAT